MAEIIVLEHTPGAGASAFVEVLDARGTLASWRRVDVPAGESLPGHLEDVAGLLVMGGTMSAVDPDVHPWMGQELDLLRGAVDADVPVFGVCLGAQLLAQALGGEVVARGVPEIGYLPLVRTDAGAGDVVVGDWPDGAPVLFVHEDEVATPPPDAVVLMEGNDGVPAWRVGSAHAVQFHPEVTGRQLADWIEQGLMDDFLSRAGVDGAALATEALQRERFTVPLGRALLARWIDAPVRARLTR